MSYSIDCCSKNSDPKIVGDRFSGYRCEDYIPVAQGIIGGRSFIISKNQTYSGSSWTCDNDKCMFYNPKSHRTSRW